MLSRVAIRNAQQSKTLVGVRAAQSAASSQDGPERDLVNFPRPTRPVLPAKVRYGFIPDGWFTMFYKKTGVTGPYAFGIGLTTYLCSKEIYVMEHEFYSGISLAIMAIIAAKKIGPAIAAYADKEVDSIEHAWKESRQVTVRTYEEAIKGEKKEQWRAEGQTLLFAAKKENIAVQLEAVYRERCATVFKEVKRRLDYQVERQNIDRRIAQKHMVQWVVNNVLKSISTQQEKDSLQKCIHDLKGLAVPT